MPRKTMVTAGKNSGQSRLTPPLKWHGGKHDLAKWIIGLMPSRCREPNNPDQADAGWLHYVEPYFGGGSVLLANDPDGIGEVVNDLNRELTDFWITLQSPEHFERFRRQVEATPFSQIEYEWARDAGGGDKFVYCRQSLAGRMDSFAPLTRNRTRRRMNEQASAWLNAVDGLPVVHQRLKMVVILNRDALDVIRSEDGPRTLFYLDPPYLHETRAGTGEYTHEMSDVDHETLLYAIERITGRFLLSGYPSEMYETFARRNGWQRHVMPIHNHAAGGPKKRMMMECVWTNY